MRAEWILPVQPQKAKQFNQIYRGFFMSFRSGLIALMASMFTLVAVLLIAGWLASSHLLGVTDVAYQQGLELTQTVDLAREAQIAFQRQVQEWKNVLIRGSDTDLRKKYWSGFQKQEATMDDALKNLSARLHTLKMEAPVENVRGMLAEHKILGQRYRAAVNKHLQLDAAAQQLIDVEVRGMDRKLSASVDTLVSDMQKLAFDRFSSEINTVRNQVTNQFSIGALITLSVTAILFVMAVMLANDVIKRLGADPKDAVAAVNRMARGDLTERFNVKTPGSLISALEMMQSRLRNISLAIRGVGDDIVIRADALAESEGRTGLLREVARLREAIGRIRIDRDVEKPS
ncbi:MAG: methyl-accepting chemotaxis protein [Candidatus Competibacteraceae bacterium]|nr:methyl-accepting chemotaxis protein [Candidatus Competibacteraceae bacterium]